MNAYNQLLLNPWKQAPSKLFVKASTRIHHFVALGQVGVAPDLEAPARRPSDRIPAEKELAQGMA